MKILYDLGKHIGLSILLILMTVFASCGGTGVGPTPPTNEPISIEFLNGATEIGIQSSFSASFSEPVDADYVDENSFFIVYSAAASISAKDTVDPDICNPSNKLAGTVTATSNILATLVLDNVLIANSNYVACVPENTIPLASGLGFTTGKQKSFTTGTAAYTTKPLVDNITPAERAMDQNLTSTNIVTTFNISDMNLASISADSTVTGTRSGALAGAWTLLTTNATFTAGSSPVCDKMTITIPTTVVDNSGNTLLSQAVRNFFTQYYYDDDFTNAANQAAFGTCYSEVDENGTGSTYTNFVAGGLQFSIAAGGADVFGPPTWAGASNNYYWYKTIDDTAIQATLHISSFTSTGHVTDWDFVYFGFEDPDSGQIFATGILVSDVVANECYATTNMDAFVYSYAQDTGACAAATEFWLRVVKNGTSFTSFYSIDGTTFTQLGAAQTLANIPSSGTEYRIITAPVYTDNIVANFSFTVESVDFTR